MDVLDIIVQLKESQISVELNGNDLKISAPKDALTSSILQQIKANKQGFITFLQKNTGYSRGTIPALTKQPSYPVSYGQKSLWILNSLEQETAGYNMFGIYEWNEEINRQTLDEAIRLMVQRHEILRTVFMAKEDEVFQLINEYEKAKWQLPFTDISAYGMMEMEKMVGELAAADRSTLFDLEKGPLLKGHLVKKDKGRYLILLTMHHIISDAWSMEIFIRELTLFYKALLKQEMPSLQNLHIQYKDYAAWHNAVLSEKTGMAGRDYWMQQFSGELPVLALAADFVRPKVKTYSGSTAGMALDKNLCTQLDKLCRKAGCSRFSALLALSSVLLYRYSGQNDFIVGIPVAGRNHPELENLLGYFVNTIGLRIQPKDDLPFLHYLTQINESLLQAYTHQDYPLGKLVEDLALLHDTSRSPLFDVMISHQKIDRPAADLQDNSITSREEAGKFDLTIDFPDYTDGVFININYNTDIFKQERIHRMITHFCELCKAVVRNSLEEIGKLNYISEAEKDTLCYGFNSSKRYYPAGHTIHGLFEKQVSQTPAATAIVCRNTALSYCEFNEKVNRVAHYLRAVHGVQPNERVGIRMGRSERLMIVLMGIIKSGAAYVPIDPAYPKDRQQYMMDDSDVRLVISEQQYRQDKLDKLLYWEDINWNEFPSTNPPVINTPEDMMYLLYTSGSTGNPKGAIIRHSSVVNHTQWLTDLIYAPANRPLKALLTGTVSFDSSVEVLFPPLVNGSSLELVGEEISNNLVAYTNLLQSNQIEVINLIPSHLHLVLQTARDQNISLQQLKFILTGGEVLQPGTSELFLSLLSADSRLINGYGPTEATVNATFEIIAQGKDLVPHSIGQPVNNTLIYVLDKKGQHTGIGIKGEICIAGIGLAKGYWKRPALTEEKFIEHPELGRLYRTGDMGSWSSGGELLFDGRLDHQVKIRGYRIELSEIEKVILRHQSVLEAIVVVQENRQELEIIAFLVWKENAENELLTSYLAEVLPNYMIPVQMVSLSAIPRMPNGKLDRKNLPVVKQDDEVIEDSTTFRETELLLLSLWKEVLGKERISIRDNFFRLGGHSLKAMRLSSAIFQQTGVKVQLHDIFKSPTIQELAVVLDHSARTAFRDIEKAAEKPLYELSHAQKRLWVQHQLKESETAYNMFSRYDWKEDLDIPLLEKAFASLTERHESLRTRFVLQEGNVFQQIASRENITWINRYVSLNTNTAQAMEQSEELCLEDINTVFDLENGPLWKYTIVKLGEKQHVILLTVHHIIADAWSMEVFVQELISIYTAFITQQASTLQPLRLQYKDYTEWHNRLLQNESIKSHQNYWLNKLQGELPVIDLQTDFPRPKIKQYTGKITSVIIPADIKKACDDIRAASGCSMFTLLAATVNTLLYRYTGQEDIITGIPAAGREHKDLEDQIGFYVNTIPFRTRVNGGDNFLQFLQNSSKDLLEAFAHQVYPFDKLVEDIAVQMDRSRSPLFDVMINHERREGYFEINAHAANTAHLNGMSKFDMQFHFAEYDNCIELILTYNDKLYLPERIDRLKDHYLQLVQSITADAGSPLGRLVYVNEKEKAAVTGIFNRSFTIVDEKSVITQFEQQVKNTPAENAVLCGGRSLTYGELNQKANTLADYLQQSGINKGDRVGIMLERSERLIIAIFAILKAGGVYVPLDPAYPDDRIAYLIKDSGAVLVLTENNGSSHFNVPQLEWDENKWKQCSSDDKPSLSSADDTIYIIYTSGSTGHPKGVSMSHRAVGNLAACVQEIISGGKMVQRLLLTASVNFDVSVGQIFGALLGGYSLVVISSEIRNDPSAYIQAIKQYEINVLDITPSYLHVVLQVLRENNIRPAGLQYIIAAGEILTPATCSLFTELFSSSGTRLINAYGPTEACVYATYKELDNTMQGTSVSIGRPLSNYHIYITDQHQQSCGIGIPGEICIAGTGLAKGYWNLDKETTERFIIHPEFGRVYRSGDYGYWTGDGEIKFSGRKDNQIKIRGYRIELGEVEEQVKNFVAVQDAIVLAQGEMAEKDLVAFVIWKENETVENLLSYLTEVLPDYMIPHRIIVLESWPRTASGKIDRKSLLLPVSSYGNYIAPVTHTEEELCAIWQEILKRERIGIEDNFFESGGHSLRAMQIVSAVYQHFGVKITIRDVFHTLTVSKMALCIDLSKKEKYDRIVPVSNQAFYPLSHSQKRIWLQCQHEVSSTAYNIVSLIKTAAPVQPFMLKEALGYMIDRHEIMRTIFRVEQGEAVQQVLSPAEIDAWIFTHDVSGLALSEKQDSIDSLWQVARLTSFDLEKGPLFRCILIEDTDEHILLFAIHHIISDAWSMKIFGEELQAIYAALEKGNVPGLLPLRIQYKDYTNWQQTTIARDHSVYQTYWLNQFQGELPVLELPADCLRPPQRSLAGNSVSLIIPAALTGILKGMQARYGITMFGLLVSTVNALLYHYTGQTDIITGVPSSGRQHKDLENQLGCYINTLAVRVAISPSSSFSRLLQEVHHQLMEAYEHQFYPFDMLVHDLNIRYDASRSPLFDVLVNYEKVDDTYSGQSDKISNHRPGSSNFDWTLHFAEFDNCIRMTVDYSTDLFLPERIDRMLSHYYQLTEFICRNPDTLLHDQQYIAPDELTALDEFNQTSTFYPSFVTIQEVFEAQVNKTPGAAAILCDDRAITYNELNQRANQLAHHLRNKFFIQPNDRIGLMMDRTENMVVAIMGILKSGAAYVPIDPNYPAQRCLYLATDSGVKLLVTDGNYLPGSGIPAVRLQETNECDGTNPIIINSAYDHCYIIYTSGSTGKPKGVAIRHHSVMNLSDWLSSLLYTDKEHQKVLLTASVSFDASVQQLFSPLFYGQTLIIISEKIRTDPELYIEVLLRNRVNVFDITPSYLHIVLQEMQEKGQQFSDLKYVLVGGETLQQETADAFFHTCQGPALLINVYGPTETCVDATAKIIRRNDGPVMGSIGVPVNNLQVHVLNEAMQQTGIGIPGELFIAGAGLASGYFNRPDLTAEKFIAHPSHGRLYRTGDRGYWSEAGEIIFGGRADNQVKLRGYRIELPEIEKAAHEFPSVAEAVVLMTKIHGQNELVIYVVWKNEVCVEELKSFIAAVLPGYMVPGYWVSLTSIPRTPGGKTDRLGLPSPVQEINPDEIILQAETPTEKIVCKIWEELLDRRAIGVNEKFVSLGGHSLKAIRMISKVYKETGARISIRDIFSHNTVRDLATKIDSMEKAGFTSIKQLPGRPDYELSHAQLQLWMVHQMESGKTAYNIFNIYPWNRPLDKDIFEAALHQLISRHENLRTIFTNSREGVRFTIIEASAIKAPLAFCDLSTMNPSVIDGAITELGIKEKEYEFSLDEAPLFRLSIIKKSENEFLILLTIHHIISDAWSVEIMLTELISFYDGSMNGAVVQPAPLPFQFRDFSQWHNKLLQSDHAEPFRKYWLNQLNGVLPVLDLPADFPRPRIKTYQGASVRAFLGQSAVQQLSAICSEADCSMFTALLACTSLLLHRYTAQDDIITGVPVAGRDQAGLEQQLGYFVNTIPLRSRFTQSTTFLQFIGGLKESLLQAYAHQWYPSDLLLDELDIVTDPGRSPLFDVMINYDKSRPLIREELSGDTERIHEPASSKFDLLFHFTDYGSTQSVTINYNTAIFSPERIDRMIAHLEVLFGNISGYKNQLISSIEYVPDSEYKLLDKYQGSCESKVESKCFQELFEEQVRQSPLHTALHFNGRVTSYNQFNEQINRLAHCLRNEFGILPGDRVGIMMDRSDNMVIAIYAVIKSGAAYVPLDPSYPAGRLGFIIEDSEIKVLLSEIKYKALHHQAVPVFYPEEMVADMYPVMNPSLVNNSNDLVYIIYTSGSTGQPKGVRITHAALTNLAEAMSQLFYRDSNRPERVLLTASVNFDVSAGQLFVPLLQGISLVIITEQERMNPDLYIAALSRCNVEALDITPSYLHLILQTMEAMGTVPVSLKQLWVAGEAFQPETYSLFKKLFPANTICYNLYGPTEACVYATCYRLPNTGNNTIPIGRPIANYRLFILDEQMAICGLGIQGEIFIGGAGLAAGYWNRDELTTEKFIHHNILGRIYRTGDMGRWDKQGNIEYFGRKDNQVKLNGVRIELGEIEAALSSHPLVREAAVTVDHTNNESLLAAYIVWKNEADIKAVQQFLSLQLPVYMVPGIVIKMEELPRTSSGKLNRLALPKPDAPALTTTMHAAPVLPAEQQLCIIWQEVLGKESVGINDNFFHIGGHSLKAMRILTRIYQQIGKRLELRNIFEAPTIRELAALLDDTEKNSFAGIQPVKKQSYYPLSHAQKRLWIIAQMGGADTAYNIFHNHTWNDALSPENMEAALFHVIKRHEILRTTFLTIEGEVCQKVHKPVKGNIPFRFIDYSHLGEYEQQTALSELSEEEPNYVFELDKGPLLQMKLVRLKETHHVILLTMHHIISDAWSVTVLVKDLLHAYRSFNSGTEPDQAPLRIQYKDFAHWQNVLLDNKQENEHKSFWYAQLSGTLPVLELPADFLRPRVKTYNGAGAAFWIGAVEMENLRSKSFQEGCSLFTVLLAAVKLLLYRYTGQQDIIVGVPVAGRDHADLEQQVGYYVNAVALRTNFQDGAVSFTNYLQQIKDRLLQCYAHQVYPLDQLVEDLDIQTERSRSPVFDVMINYEKPDYEAAVHKETGFGDHIPAVSKFDIVFQFSEYKNGIGVYVNYNTDIYAPARIKRLLAHLHELMATIPSINNEAICSINYIPAEEIMELQRFNDTERNHFPLEKTVHQLLEKVAEHYPENPAIYGADGVVTYNELNSHANRLAHYLWNEFDIQPDDCIGVMMDRSEKMVITLLAILKAGAAYVPLDPALPSNRLEYIVADCSLKVIITEQGYYSGASPVIHWEQLEIRDYPAVNPVTNTTSSNLCYVIYTSGSTGQPKGVMIEHRSLINLCCWHAENFSVNTNSRGSLYAGISFDASVWETWPYLLNGACIYPVPEDNRHQLQELMNYVSHHQLTHSFLPTPVFEELSDTVAEWPKKWKLLTGGDQLKKISNSLPVYNNYGPTECTVVSTSWNAAKGDAAGVIPIGKPIANTQIYILDKQGCQVPIGVYGEIFIAGEGVGRGYLNNEELTSQKFILNPVTGVGMVFKSGDNGRWLEDGNIQFSGRKDGQVKLRGYRIETKEIENALHQYAGIPNARVLMVQNNGQGAYLSCFYTGEMKSGQQIRATIEKWLPGYMVPSWFVHIERFPLTLNGKIDDAPLLAMAPKADTAAISENVPKTASEKLLHSSWTDILGIEQAGITDDFFELGGHSLKAIKLIAAIEKAFGQQVSLKDIFNYSTISSMAALLDGKRAANDSLLVKLNKEKSGLPLLYLVPPLIGSATIYKNLAMQVEGSYNCYGLQFPGFDNEEPFCDSVESLAGVLAAQINTHHSSGTVYLLGYSFGAMVAFEIAKCIEKTNSTVKLFIIDKEPNAASLLSRRKDKSAQSKNNQDRVIEEELSKWTGLLSFPDYKRVRLLAAANYANLQQYRQKGVLQAAIITIGAAKNPVQQDMSKWKKYTNNVHHQYNLKADHYNVIMHAAISQLLLRERALFISQP